MPRRNQPVKSSAHRTPPVFDTDKEGDLNLRGRLTQDRGSYQSSHGTRGYGDDDERADPDDAKVKGRSRANHPADRQHAQC